MGVGRVLGCVPRYFPQPFIFSQFGFLIVSVRPPPPHARNKLPVCLCLAFTHHPHHPIDLRLPMINHEESTDELHSLLRTAAVGDPASFSSLLTWATALPRAVVRSQGRRRSGKFTSGRRKGSRELGKRGRRGGEGVGASSGSDEDEYASSITDIDITADDAWRFVLENLGGSGAGRDERGRGRRWRSSNNEDSFAPLKR